ncbi:TatD family hydrolase [Mycoplasma nasistruthionis]|uniref:TatD family deoxyribonuclease n=1 Tax=Mycoplasma nasistruthionis TaxID=353852 RepID=A0A4Y6I6A4_9MOLU|nr:TatD family hydrolase [Mycoplasma nasistruthionis]QDF65146.1 TatD family deoxyribonuclease [Mycoplasma nasistruthionis]
MAKKQTLFIDAHSHIADPRFNDSAIVEIVNAFQYNRIEFTFVNGGNVYDNQRTLALKQALPDKVEIAIGIHPEAIKTGQEWLTVEPMLNNDVKAIGEIGLDYYYDDAPDRQVQLASFENQVILALKHNLPVVVHIRDKENSDLAYQDAFEILEKHKPKFMLHTYAGSVEWAHKFIKLGGYISFSGTITFGSNQTARHVAKIVPLDRILTETDAPYLRPHPYINEINEPNTVIYTAYYLGGLLGLGMDKFVSRVNKNIKEFLNIK